MSVLEPPPPTASGRFALSFLGRCKLALARLALLWERLWLALWPAVGIAGLWLVLALFDLLPALPGWLHLIVLLALAGCLVEALRRAFVGMRLPGRLAAQHRLEQDSGLPHRPLLAVEDDMATGRGDPLSRALWRAHLLRARLALARLRLRAPAPGLPRHDPRALRAGLAVLLLAAALGAWGDALPRLQRSLVPQLWAGTPAGQFAVDVWIDPPAYTGRPPIYLKDAAAPAAEAGADGAKAATPAVIAVPHDSKVFAQVQGVETVPTLEVGSEAIAAKPIEPGVFRAGGVLRDSGVLRVRRDDDTLREWQIEVIPDRAPTIAFDSAPSESRQGALRLSYRAADDYGITAVKAEIRLSPTLQAASADQVLEVPLPPPSGSATGEGRSSSYHDLTAHVWAGLPVTIELIATDAIGQVGRSERLDAVLPERVFKHPVAQALAQQRKRLTLDPKSAPQVADELDKLSRLPHAYFDDPTVFLGMRIARQRLLEGAEGKDLDEIKKLLWDLALHVEDGKLALAMRDLRAAERALQDALANEQTSDAEIERLLDELQQKLSEYLQALAEELQRQMEAGVEMPPIDPSAMTMESSELQRVIDRVRELARSGARDAARQMLAQLQEMLENLRAQPLAGRMQGQDPAQQMMQGLQDLIQRQQKLLDETFRRAQRGEGPQQQGQQGPQGQQGEMGQQGQQAPGQPGPGRQGQGQFGQRQFGQGQPGQQGQRPGPGMQPMPGVGAQQALRDDLGDFVRRLGEMMGDIPRPFVRADRAMRDAIGALEQGLPGQAVPPQTEALDQLRQGAQQAMQQMMQGQMQSGLAPGQGNFQQGQGRDPFGRNVQGPFGFDRSDMRIPDESDLQHSREIVDELRRRAGDRDRPRIEQDYIERLLRRF